LPAKKFPSCFLSFDVEKTKNVSNMLDEASDLKERLHFVQSLANADDLEVIVEKPKNVSIDNNIETIVPY
jgi:hypothetical protein